MPTTNHNFELNRLYSRRDDIHAHFGGQAQSGIVTPRDCEYIFLFTGESGTEYGYEDHWDDNGVFHYVGEGQVGDMQFVRGNRAIRDHSENGKLLMLFSALGQGKPVRFTGAFHCANWRTEQGVDRNGDTRKIYVFHLVPETGDYYFSKPEAEPSELKPDITLVTLRKRAYEVAGSTTEGNSSAAKRNYYKRSQAVKRYVIARADGVCESCLEPAPFLRENGTPYLEPHHTRRVSDSGPDHPRWIGAVCPNCHREIHYGENGKSRNDSLIRQLGEIEKLCNLHRRASFMKHLQGL